MFKEYKVLKAARQPHKVSASIPKAPPKYKDHHFVVVYITQGFSPFVEKSLDSICNQQYQNYRIVYVQNGAEKGVQRRVENCLFQKKIAQRIEILNYPKVVPLATIYKQIVGECKEDDIIVVVNQHDWLSRFDVLTKLNETYQDEDVWLAYGNRLEYPSLRRPQAQPKKAAMNQRRLMKMPWSQASIKSFYAHLLSQIDLETLAIDYVDDDEIDYEFLMPMIKLAKWHIRHIPEVLSIHNRLRIPTDQPPLVIGQMMDQFSHHFSTCLNLAKGSHESVNHQKSDLIVLSRNQPFRLDVCLESVFRNMSGLDSVYVIYSADETHQGLYRQLQSKYQHVHFQQEQGALKPLMMSILKNRLSTTQFVTVATDDQLIQRPIQIGECIAALTQTDADAFYLNMQKEKMLLKRSYAHVLPDRIHILHPKKEMKISPLDLVLFRKSDLIHQLNRLEFTNAATLVEYWSKSIGNPSLGLYFETSKATKLK